MRGLECPICHTDQHQPHYEQYGLFVCQSCGTVLGYLCKGCDRVYLENHLILHGDAQVCKFCGTPQWGYTEYARNKKRGEIA